MNDRPTEGMPAEAVAEPPTRQPVFNLPGIVVVLIAACAGIHLLRAYVLTPEQDFGVILRFAFIPLRYSGDYAIDIYAWLGPVTYAFLHGDMGHLIVNMVWLAAFGSPLANRIGAVGLGVFWLLTGLAAVGLHYVIQPLDAVPLVGASGAISGMMGAASRFAFRIERRGRRAAFAGPVLSISSVFTYRATVTFLAVWMVVNLVIGMGYGADETGSQIAWQAHMGGFAAGFLAIPLFARRPALG